MNKKLNTIALATSLASLGFCSLSFGWQTDSSPLFGTGVTNAVDTQQVDTMLPPIVSTAGASVLAEENLPPIVTGKLIRQVSAESPGIPPKELNTFSEGGGLKPLNSIMSKAPNVYRAPAPPKPPVARVAKAAQPAPAKPQGSGSRSGSGTRSVLGEIGQNYADGAYGGSPQQGAQDLSQSSPEGIYGTSQTYSAPNQNGLAPNDFGQGAYADPTSQSAPGFADGTSYFDPNAGAYGTSPVSNCATCGNGLVDGACSNCGPAAGYSDGPVIRDYGTFGSVSAANRYLYIDGLGMTRADGDIENSNFGTLNDFDFTSGVRATFGRRDDSIFGRELGFFALPGVEQEISRNDPLIQTPFLADQGARLTVFTVPVTGASADAFTGATSQTQRKESDLYAVEFNRVNWGWDLIKTFSGFRYISFQDSYNVQSTGTRAQVDAFGNVITNATGNTQFDEVNGDFTLDASNTLVGFQVGGELFYDVGYRWSASGFGKFGLFANFNDYDTNFTNGDFNVSSESDNVTVSSAAELGILAHYQIRTNLRFRAGYNAFFIGNVATTADNIGNSSGLFTGAEANDSDDVFFHGFNFGLEFYR